MGKRIEPPLTFGQFGTTVTYDGDDVTVTKKFFCDSPASACVTISSKLEALMLMLSGEGFDAFDSLHEESKNNLLWLISDMAHETRTLAELAHLHTHQLAVAK